MDGLRAGLGAQTFLIPQAQQQVAPTQAKPFDDGVAVLENLQYVEGQTADYYKKASELKSFMQSVQKNLGIDVRVPDLSRPESIELNQIYKNAISDLLSHGNELKTGYNMQQTNTQMGNIYSPETDPTKQAVSTMKQGQDYYSRNFEPGVVEINNKTQMPSYTEEEHKQKEKIYEDSIKKYDALSAKYPNRKAYYEYQKSGLTPPTKGEFRPFNPYNAFGAGQKSKDNAMEVFFRKAVNFTGGKTNQWITSTKPVPGESGQFYLRNNEYAGMKYGDKQLPIRYAEMNPKDKTGYFVLEDGSTVPFDAKDPVPMLQGLIDANPNFGFKGDDMMDYMHRNGIFTGSGALNTTMFQDKSENQEAATQDQEKQRVENQAYYTLIGNKLKERSSGKTNRWFRANDMEEISIPFGGASSIQLEAVADNKFVVKNFDDMFRKLFTNPKTNKIDQNSKISFENRFRAEGGMSMDEIVNNLLPMIPKSQYKQLFDALHIPKDKLDSLIKELSGTKSAETNTEEETNPFLTK